MGADYTFLFADLLTNAVIAELPLLDPTFGRVLNGAGSISGALVLGDARVRSLDPIGATEPNRRVVYVVRDGDLLPPVFWLRTRRYQDGNLELNGSELWSYFSHRIVRATLDFEDVDQAAIVDAVIAALQALPSGDVGLVVDAAATEIYRTLTIYDYEAKPAEEVIEKLAEALDGFDFSIDVTGNPSAPTKTLVVDHPRRGVQAFETDLLFELPGNVLRYSWPEDGTRQANVVVGAGGGEGDDMLLWTSTSAESLADGFPLLEKAGSYKDVRDIEYLEPLVDAELEAAVVPVTIPELVVRGDVDPIVGSYDTGDDLRLVVLDDRFPAGLETFARIVGYDVRPEDPEEEIEKVTLTLGEAIA